MGSQFAFIEDGRTGVYRDFSRDPLEMRKLFDCKI
jgi:hypothetical protein